MNTRHCILGKIWYVHTVGVMREVMCGVGVKYSTKIMPVKTDMSRPQHKNYEEEVSTVGEEKIWYHQHVREEDGR